jgi:hypothetical protein
VALADAIVVDDQILALAAEIIRLNEIADKIAEDRILPLDDEFFALLHSESGAQDRNGRAECAFGQRCGRDVAIEDQAELRRSERGT